MHHRNLLGTPFVIILINKEVFWVQNSITFFVAIINTSNSLGKTSCAFLPPSKIVWLVSDIMSQQEVLIILITNMNKKISPKITFLTCIHKLGLPHRSTLMQEILHLIKICHWGFWDDLTFLWVSHFVSKSFLCNEIPNRFDAVTWRILWWFFFS